MTATHDHHHAPAPTPGGLHDSRTDRRESWPIWYSLIAGGILWVLGGVALSGHPVIYTLIIAAVVAILWVLQFIGEANGITVLARVPTRGALGVSLMVVIIGLVAWLIGKFTGTVLVNVVVALTGGIGIFMPIISFTVAILASVGLLLAVSYNARRWTVLCLVAFGVMIMLMTQQATGVKQTPYERTKEVCTSQQAQNFPAECGR